MKILIAEDNIALKNSLELAFSLKGYDSTSASDGNEAMYMIENQSYDILLLDVGLPGLSGFDIARQIRKHNDRIPILFLTARDSIKDKLEGFSTGGDDYLVKPFELEELFARIHALLKRSYPLTANDLHFGDVSLDSKNNIAFVNGVALNLTYTEFKILEYFLLNPQQVLSRIQIANRIWDVGESVESNSISVHIHNIRKKLADAKSKARIKTIRNMGYKLE